MDHHVLELLDLLPRVAPADAAVRHRVVPGGGQVVEGGLWRRQGGAAGPRP